MTYYKVPHLHGVKWISGKLLVEPTEIKPVNIYFDDFCEHTSKQTYLYSKVEHPFHIHKYRWTITNYVYNRREGRAYIITLFTNLWKKEGSLGQKRSNEKQTNKTRDKRYRLYKESTDY